jgi:4-hydroxy-3-polyprenylbenzoate decarboxylase
MNEPPSSGNWSSTVTVALTGASGMPYGMRLIEALIGTGTRVYLLYSQAAQVVARQELDMALPGRATEAAALLAERYGARQGQLIGFGREEWFAPVASGSNPPDAMVVCPCSMGTLAGIAAGVSDNLIERAADVVIKEGRKLILVPRETPFSTLHLENMLRLSRMGVVILPPSPGFYHHPRSVDDLVDFIVGRVLDQLRISHDLSPRWGEERLTLPRPTDSPARPPEGSGGSDKSY